MNKTLSVPPGTYVVPSGITHYELTIDPRIAESQDFVFHLESPGSSALIRAVLRTKGKECPVVRTTVVHHAPKTNAETLVLTVARAASAPRHEGLIRIEQAAEESISHLTNKTLLLDSEARTWTRPSLEILTGNVQCSHAATVRTIGADDLYAFATRGIDKQTARRTLIRAFLAQTP